MFSKSRNLIFAAVAGIFLIGSTGCTSAADPTEPPATTQIESSAQTSVKPSPVPKPTPTPVPASSKGPAQNWPVPKMPEAAKKKTEAGIVAFTAYWFELVEYSDITNDTVPIKSVTGRSCYLCAKQIIDPVDQNKATGAWRTGGAIETSSTLAKLIGNDGVSGFSVDRKEMTGFTSSGNVQGVFPATVKPMVGTLYVFFENGWQVVDIQFLDTSGGSK